MVNHAARHLDVDATFSLAVTCGPVAWARGRWPNVDWLDGTLVWVGWEADRLVHRLVRHSRDDLPSLEITGSAAPEFDAAWARATLGLGRVPPIGIDATVEAVRARFPGLRPWANGSLFEGLVGSIVGQSISVAAAAVTENRLAALFHEGIDLAGRRFRPQPRADQLATAEPALVRQSGVTWRRAEALVHGAQAFLGGHLPTDDEARADPDAARAALRRCRLAARRPPRLRPAGPRPRRVERAGGGLVAPSRLGSPLALGRPARAGPGSRDISVAVAQLTTVDS
jgi:hypothetical protein